MNDDHGDHVVEELRETDKLFSEFARTNGVANAFSAFCSLDAIHISSNGYPTVGREKIVKMMKEFEQTYMMSWEPQIIKANSDYNKGVTKGSYELFECSKKVPPIKIGSGQYLTVWQKQKTGEWKVIYDMDGGIFHT